ncbi:MAG: exodeoxyribonuclease VII large subunit [Paracoccaceae bacterium]|nr:exodeoxyribonuclease VII large subunit [Paracoccaceae bacterium]
MSTDFENRTSVWPNRNSESRSGSRAAVGASETGVAGGNVPEFSVSEISRQVKREIENQFGRVRVRGEVGRVTRARSGHVYLDLKENGDVLAAVIWRGTAARLTSFPEEGLEVVATGKLTAFSGQSRYQLSIEFIEPAGIGALMAMLEERRKRLQSEGLFDTERKRPLPHIPDVIGVVTSPTGSVIRDILHRLQDRFPRTVLVWPVAVQGPNCPPEVVAALDGFNALEPSDAISRPDLLIVARGGGSVEDLWGFNDEQVVRAVAASRIPVISAIGHETDTTLIDHVADFRAPTPTAAAERAVPVLSELLSRLSSVDDRRTAAVARLLGTRRDRLSGLYRAIPNPMDYVHTRSQRLDDLSWRLSQSATRSFESGKNRFQQISLHFSRATARIPEAWQARLETVAAGLRPMTIRRMTSEASRQLTASGRALSRAGHSGLERTRDRLESTSRMLESLGYVATLERGYALVRAGDAEGPVITDADSAKRLDGLDIQFRDGHVQVRPSP